MEFQSLLLNLSLMVRLASGLLPRNKKRMSASVIIKKEPESTLGNKMGKSKKYQIINKTISPPSVKNQRAESSKKDDLDKRKYLAQIKQENLILDKSDWVNC